MNPDWLLLARCRGTNPETFFPAPGESYAPARRFCARCEVRAECLADALAIEGRSRNAFRDGMYGGLTPTERRAHARVAA